MTLTINNRPDHIISSNWSSHPGKIKDILIDLLPLLSLHKTTSALGSCGLFACHTAALNWKQEKAKSACLVAGMVTYIGISALAPIPCVVVSSVFKTYTILKEPNSNIMKISMVAHQVIYVASMYYATPGLIALSLFCQMVTELHQATKGFTQKPSSLKDAVNVLVACARFRAVFPHAERAYRNYFGKKLTQNDWDEISCAISERIQKVHEQQQDKKPPSLMGKISNFIIRQDSVSEKEVNVEKELKEKGFSNILEGITLRRENPMGFPYFTVRLVLSDVVCKNCFFSQGLFTDTHVKNAIFNNCVFIGRGNLINSAFTSVTFNKCNLAYSIFSKCVFKDVSFNRCNFSHAIFHFSDFFNSRIFNSELEGTCFLSNNVRESVIEGCLLLNTILLEAKSQFSFKDCGQHVFNMPIVIFPIHINEQLRFAPLIMKALRNKGVLVLPFETCPKDVDLTALQEEIFDSLTDIESFPPMDMLSRADEVLKRANPGSQISLIRDKAEVYISQSSGLVIPGGPHVEEEFYKTLSSSRHTKLKYTKEFIATIADLHFLQDNIGDHISEEFCHVLVDKGFVKRTPGHTFTEDFICSIGKICLRESTDKDLDFTRSLHLMSERCRDYARCRAYIWSGINDPIQVARIFLRFLKDSIANNAQDEKKHLTRTITEFVLLRLASARNLATLGVCRGSQLINVFFGGTLQNVVGQKGYQHLQFTESPAAQKLQDQLGVQEPFIGYSYHEQAVERLGKGLEAVLKYANVVKLSLHKTLPIMGSQFHPEQSLYVSTQELFQEDLEEERAGHISPASYHDFIRANLGIYQLFIDNIKRVFKKNATPTMTSLSSIDSPA